MGPLLLQTRRVPVKSPAIELEWIWQEMSNDVRWLKERKVNIWNDWEGDDHTIGKAYGWQLANKHININGQSLNQVQYVLQQLKDNPTSRRIMTTLYDFDDLNAMNLPPCVWSTHWSIHDNKLNLHVKQRSCDFLLGGAFNFYQYYLLHTLISDELQLERGTMHWNIDNCHIYDRHIEGAKELLKKWEDNRLELLANRPSIVLPEGTNFFDRRLSDIQVLDYQHLGNYKFELAVNGGIK